MAEWMDKWADGWLGGWIDDECISVSTKEHGEYSMCSERGSLDYLKCYFKKVEHKKHL